MSLLLKRKKKLQGKSDSVGCTFQFTSFLLKDHSDELEQLLFFNPQQKRYSAVIMKVIEETGLPTIVCDGIRLRIKIGSELETHTLFAIAHRPNWQKLVGVIIFRRPTAGQLLVLHIAVDHDYAMSGRYAGLQLTFKMIEEVKRVAMHIKGVREVGITYGHKTGHTIFLPVAKKTNQI